MRQVNEHKSIRIITVFVCFIMCSTGFSILDIAGESVVEGMPFIEYLIDPTIEDDPRIIEITDPSQIDPITHAGGPTGFVIYHLNYDPIPPSQVAKPAGCTDDGLIIIDLEGYFNMETSEFVPLVKGSTSQYIVDVERIGSELNFLGYYPFDNGMGTKYYRAAMYNRTDGWQDIPLEWSHYQAPFNEESYPYDMSDNGRWVTGQAGDDDDTSWRYAFAHDLQTGTTDPPLRDEDNPTDSTYGRAISDDGQTVVGWTQKTWRCPIVWQSGVPTYPVGKTYGQDAELQEISADGSRAGGYYRQVASGAYRFWTWTPGGGAVACTDTPIGNEFYFMWTNGVSSDGNTFVGSHVYGAGHKSGWAWTNTGPAGGELRSIGDYFVDIRGIPDADVPDAWQAEPNWYAVMGMSEDTNCFVIRNEGQMQKMDTYIAYIVPPQTQKPSSFVEEFSETMYWQTSTINLTAGVTDAIDGIDHVDLWYRYSPDGDLYGGKTWGPWAKHSGDTNYTYDYYFDFPDGEGHYEFYSIAYDPTGWVEPAPAIADVGCCFDPTPPSSQLYPIPYDQYLYPIILDGTVIHGPCPTRRVDLYFAYSSDNVSWEPYLTDLIYQSMPYRFNPKFWKPGVNGVGYWRFYTRAQDEAYQYEDPPGAPGYDVELFYSIPGSPSSQVVPLTQYWHRWSTSINMQTTEGVTYVQLNYRYRANESDAWGPWLYGDSDSSPSPTTGFYVYFDWNSEGQGEGHYEFYCNISGELKFNSETGGGFDETGPTTSPDPIIPYAQQESPLTITAQATDTPNGSGMVGEDNVELWYRYAPTPGAFATWIRYGVDFDAPWEWDFAFPQGNGYYEFFTAGTDNASCYEYPSLGYPTTAQADCSFFPPLLDHVTIAPANWTMFVNENMTFTASGWNDVGETLLNHTCQFLWEVSGGGTLDVSNLRNLDCNFNATSVWTWTLYANSTGLSGVAVITVESLPVTHNISLDLGWNLISLPLEQTDEWISEALSGIDGKWDCIQAFDALSPDPWKTNATFRPAALNDLHTLDHRMGFWINITEPGVTLTVSGDLPTSTSIQLYTGWNLVGYPSLTQRDIATALAGTGYDQPVEGFNPVAPYRISPLSGTYMMTPGEAYWIHVPADTTWVIDW